MISGDGLLRVATRFPLALSVRPPTPAGFAPSPRPSLWADIFRISLFVVGPAGQRRGRTTSPTRWRLMAGRFAVPLEELQKCWCRLVVHALSGPSRECQVSPCCRHGSTRCSSACHQVHLRANSTCERARGVIYRCGDVSSGGISYTTSASTELVVAWTGQESVTAAPTLTGFRFSDNISDSQVIITINTKQKMKCVHLNYF